MKFMNMKRFGSIAMAGALALSLAAPAFAVGTTTTIEGGYQDMEISVVVPESGTAQINPYGLPVEVTKSDGATKVQITGQQITSLPLSLKNQGNVPMAVSASLTVLPKGDAIIKENAIGATEKGKEINVTLEVAGLNDNALKLDSLDPTLDDLLLDKFAADSTWSGLAAASKLAAKDANKGATTGTAAKSTAAMATLGAATVADGTVTYGAKSIALFRLSGKVNEAPNDGAAAPNTKDTPWAEADGFTATVVFGFKPADKLDVTVTAPSGTGADLKANITKAWEGTEITLTSVPPTTTSTHVPTYKVVSTAAPTDATKFVTVTDGKFIMPDYAVTVSVTFAAP